MCLDADAAERNSGTLNLSACQKGKLFWAIYVILHSALLSLDSALEMRERERESTLPGRARERGPRSHG